MIVRLRVVLPLVLSCIGPAQTLAQNEGGQTNFDFSLPGARSRAIGGAFVAIADDATSVYSNPAGLTRLFRPEISAEVRHWSLTTKALDHGHGFGPASGRGVDTIDGFVDKGFHSHVTGLSFLSFVYPHNRWAVGLFRHQLARQRQERQIEGPFFDCKGGYRSDNPPAPPFCLEHARNDGVDREFPKRQWFDLNIHSTGTAFAYKISDKLSLGVALQYFDFTIEGTDKVFWATDEQKYLPANFTDQNLAGTLIQAGHNHAWAMNAGVLWNVSATWVVGGSFRQGPHLTFTTTTTSFQDANIVKVETDPNRPLHVPDTFSVGVLHRLSDFWRVSVEYDRINYHQLVDDFQDPSSNQPQEEALVAQRLRLDNANQLRLGAERLVLRPGGYVLALRGGLWYDPNHQVYFDVDESTGLPLPRYAVLLPRRDGSLHVSGGVGLTTRRHLQLDVAVDFSEPVDTLAISTVWRF